MDRSEVIARLKAHEAELKHLGVQHIYLFGSTARGLCVVGRGMRRRISG